MIKLYSPLTNNLLFSKFYFNWKIVRRKIHTCFFFKLFSPGPRDRLLDDLACLLLLSEWLFTWSWVNFLQVVLFNLFDYGQGNFGVVLQEGWLIILCRLLPLCEDNFCGLYTYNFLRITTNLINQIKMSYRYLNFYS